MLGFKITEIEKILAIMYWIPIMHKDTTGAHFIIASKTCSTKQISKFVSNVFQLVFSNIITFHPLLILLLMEESDFYIEFIRLPDDDVSYWRRKQK